MTNRLWQLVEFEIPRFRPGFDFALSKRGQRALNAVGGR
jgi:hypothetical protein